MSRVVAQAIRSMMDAGLTLEQALLAVEKMDEAKRGSAKSNAERQAEFRARQKSARNAVTSNESNASNVTSVTEAAPYTEDARTYAEPEPNKTTYPTTSEANASSVEPPKRASKPRGDRASCIVELSAFVRPDIAEAVVEHREKIRKPMTPTAARLLGRRLATDPDPNAAAELMIERGWQGYRPDWGQNARGSPPRPAKRNTALDGLDELERRFSANVQPAPHLRIAG